MQKHLEPMLMLTDRRGGRGCRMSSPEPVPLCHCSYQRAALPPTHTLHGYWSAELGDWRVIKAADLRPSFTGAVGIERENAFIYSIGVGNRAMITNKVSGCDGGCPPPPAPHRHIPRTTCLLPERSKGQPYSQSALLGTSHLGLS